MDRTCGDAGGDTRAGRGKPGASGVAQAKPRRGAKLIVAKRASLPPRKAAIAPYEPVPETDTGRQGEDPKAGGRSIAKELGKTAP